MKDHVTVEVGRVDASIMPSSFSFPLIDALINQSKGLIDTANKANSAGDDANQALSDNERQDAAINDNSKAITLNSEKIENNKESIIANTDLINNHKSDNSAHGANGNIVGDKNFASLSVGGVVLLASEVPPPNLLPVELTDAPAEYSQEYTQSLVSAIRSLAENQTTVSNTLNGIITAMQNAKQMNKGVTQ